MSQPDRRDADDVAWLEARERGAAELPALPASRVAAYDELQQMIGDLPDEAPPPGWEAEVHAAIANERERPGAATPRPARRVPRWIPATVTAMAAAAALVVWWRRPASDPMHEDAPRVEIVDGRGVTRGPAGVAALGDTLRVEARGAGELRIYRDDRALVLRCPGDAGCTTVDGHQIGTLVLTAPGRYRAVTLAPRADEAIGPPTGSLDGDVAACGCTATTAVPIVVQ